MDNKIVYVVSDSVGETADLVVRAAMGQFPFAPDIRRVPYVEDTGTLKEVISIAKSNQALICFTLVKPDMRQYLVAEAAKEGVEAYDIIGPLIDQIEEITGQVPRYEPGVVRRLDEEYFKKIEAIEFAVKYDDGRDARGILKADIVLIGISRTSKTPLSQYLAHNKRLKVANVPLVPEVDPPEELYQVAKEKCFGLKITPDKLNHIRKERLKSLGLSDGATYANINRIKEEIDHFENVVGKIDCQVIDVSNKAIEETANIIVNAVQNQKLF
ncbi:pyruvate, water dikinase regulatory protein [Bacillus mobilis]|uniref:Putative pyruvate, phosphate dikinase regulatory protein n=2 Tax=Bacillus cereus group TaxID=86661 RepID=A0A1C4ETQ3_BACCE|nr:MULTISPECIES: pyruvate, water dikinase regulatory protein [Bacillus cereus group]MCC2459475.1 kinase/pyrophosphorylase [Bacillus mobilis]MCU5431530.1 kinase/pyrophosphorylase [Bacillus mobilis]MCU5590523.1 kinase/pyrophosphorylase [Bacillus mobilis]MCU5734714.1 kinase/pyrophosphorylase [Bacillus mobilis]MCU9557367.1 kinase/pyrophosphorylase [Bacillus mobilis]